MLTCTVAEAKRFRRSAHLTTWQILKKPDGWVVDLGGILLAAARDEAPRVFKSLDSAVSALEQIGFEISALRKGDACACG